MALMVGISGIRGIVGSELTPAKAFALGLAIREAKPNLKALVLGRDSRPTGAELLDGFLRAFDGLDLRLIDLGIVTTPAAGLMVRRMKADLGILITASHNPAPYNGIKLITAKGHAPRKSDVGQIYDAFRALLEREPDIKGDVPQAASVNDAGQIHADRVLELVDVQAIRAQQFKVVLDSVCGAGGPSGRYLLEKLGCRIRHVHSEPTGQFPHEPEPIEANLTELCSLVKDDGAAIGFAQDPDADRLAIVDEKGRFIGEEYTQVLGAINVLRNVKGTVVTNLSASKLIDDAVAQVEGCHLKRSPVGEAHVVELMFETSAVVGGEGNGGLIDPRVGPIRDSLVSMAHVLELMTVRRESVSSIVDSLPQYHTVKKKILCPPECVSKVIESARELFSEGRIDNQDGLRVDFPAGWFQIRGSNTEPIIRIMSESTDARQAQAWIDDLAACAGKVLA